MAGFRGIIRDEGLLPMMIDYIRNGDFYFHKFIAKEDFQQGKIIASGAGGKIFECDWNGNHVVVKQCADQGILFSSKEEIRMEVALMSIFSHPNVLYCLGANLRAKYPYFLMPRANYCLEYLILGDEENNLQIPLPFGVRYSFAHQIALGMGYIHTWKIIHRDLKSANILVNEDFRCYITDFGISRLSDKNRMTLNLGTISWMAPELFKGDGHYTEAVDVYSFGVLLWELAARKRPHVDCESWSIPDQVIRGLRPTIPPSCPPEFTEIINSCWRKNPAKRPTFSQLAVQFKELCSTNEIPPNYSMSELLAKMNAKPAELPPSSPQVGSDGMFPSSLSSSTAKARAHIGHQRSNKLSSM